MSEAFRPLAAVLGEPAVVDALRLSAEVALATLALHLLLGLALGYALARPGWVGRGLLDALVTLPLVFPPVATGFLLLMLLGRRGPLGAWLGEAWGVEVVFSFWGVLIASLVAGLVLGLGRSLGEVGITLMLGGNVSGRTTTVSLEIFNAVGGGEFERAAVLSLLLGLVSLALFAVLRRLGAL